MSLFNRLSADCDFNSRVLNTEEQQQVIVAQSWVHARSGQF